MQPATVESFITYLKNLLQITEDDIKEIVRDFHFEMLKGLSGYESTLKMIPAFVDRPTGKEEGKFIALDLGGTNFRVLAVELDGKSSAKVIAVNKYVVSKAEMEGTGEQLFGFIARCIKEFMEEHSFSLIEKTDIAFTFSFPVDQSNIAAGTLISWTKGFSAKNVVGHDIVVCMNEALLKEGVKNVKIAALVNDTVGTLIAKSYTDSDCDVGVILGTGTNACYPEKMANIKKWRGMSPKNTMIINTEWGNFDKIRVTSYDKVLDRESPNQGKQKYEKQTSGMYLGELFRLVLVDLMNRDIIFPGSSLGGLGEKGAVRTEDMSMIEADFSPNLENISAFLRNFGLDDFELSSCVTIKMISRLLSTRSARLAAAGIIALVTWLDPELKEKHIIGIDGTLYEKFPEYKSRMEEVFQLIFKNKVKNINLELSKDGSGKGAAITAAIAASYEKSNS